MQGIFSLFRLKKENEAIKHRVIGDNKNLFQSLLNRYQIGLETSITGSDFIFGCVKID